MYSIHTIAKNISSGKIIIGFAIVVLGTLGNLAFGAINYVVTSKFAPVVARVEAIESKDGLLEQALVELKADNKQQHLTIESKLDRLLIKLAR